MASDPKNALVPTSPNAAAETRQLRGDIAWIDDKDLRTLQEKDEGATWALSMFFGGGGQMYTQQYLLGACLIAADIALLWLWWPLYFALGAVSSVFAFRSARQINRYVAARSETQRTDGPTPGEYRLLSAMTAADPKAQYDAAKMQAMGVGPTAMGAAQGAPGPGQPGQAAAPQMVAGIDLASIRGRLTQLAALRGSAVINDEEHRERRIDALGVLQGLERDEMDEVLFHLIDMINGGYMSNEDVDFLKRMGGG